MATIVTRAAKGSPLSNTELDSNFSNLNTELGQKLHASNNLSDLPNAATARTHLGLGAVENKSSATIRAELSSSNVTTALGYTPYNSTNPSGFLSSISSAQITSALGYTPPQPNGTSASGTWPINVSGNASNITAYTVNQSVGSSNAPTFADVYLNGWFRNNASGQGIYNQATSNHFYSDGGYWNVGYAGTNGLRLRNGHNGTVMGSYYGETNGNSGLLNQSGNWKVRINGSEMEFYDTSYANDVRAYVYYDRNDTTFFADLNSTGTSIRAAGNITAYYSDRGQGCSDFSDRQRHTLVCID